jgi:hypothetical protein
MSFVQRILFADGAPVEWSIFVSERLIVVWRCV